MDKVEFKDPPRFGSPLWFDLQWERVPEWQQRTAAEAVRQVIPEKDFDLIRSKHAKYGSHEWIHHLIDIEPGDGAWGSDDGTLSGHHIWGTAIRNAIRKEISDADLPPVEYENGMKVKNWDDFYVSAIEQAAGLR